jgi:hypothetical protein
VKLLELLLDGCLAPIAEELQPLLHGDLRKDKPKYGGLGGISSGAAVTVGFPMVVPLDWGLSGIFAASVGALGVSTVPGTRSLVSVVSCGLKAVSVVCWVFHDRFHDHPSTFPSRWSVAGQAANLGSHWGYPFS